MRRPVTTVYQLKIVVEGIRPQVWRRVLVPADIRLSHLHAFAIGGVQYSMPYEELGDDLHMEDERRVRFSSLVPKVKAQFGYQYDFGDDWQHTVLVEKILPADPASHDPVCAAANRAGPPEDWGVPQQPPALFKSLSRVGV